MSVSIAKGSQFLGVPLLVARNVLRAWTGCRNVQVIGQRRDVALHSATVAVMIEEFRQRGLIGREQRGLRSVDDDGLTQAGRALASAKGNKRAPRAKAQAIFDAYIENCAKLNARTDLPFRIEQVWLFGSMLNEEREDVGDVDFVPIFSRTSDALDFDEEQRQYDRLADSLGISRRGLLDGVFIDERVRSRLTLNGSRHPLLAPNNLEQLTSLGAPCRLVFDAERGGRVDDPVLPRHPESRGKSDGIGPPRTMPRLDAPQGSVEPSASSIAIPSFILGHDALVRISATRNLPHDTQRMLRFGSFARPTLVTGEPSSVREKSAAMEGLDLTGCDGRWKFGLLVGSPAADPYRPDEGPFQFGFVVERSITINDGVTDYTVRITQYAADDDVPTGEGLMQAELSLHALMEADVERILRRDAEIGVSTQLRIDVGSEIAARQAERLSMLVDNLRADVAALVRAAEVRTGQAASLEAIFDLQPVLAASF